jgi:hypothetical protein
MAKVSKRVKALSAQVDRQKLMPVADAISLVKKCATAKFDESIDVAVQLGIDAKKSDQLVRGSVVLPAGTGKTVRVAVFTQGAKADEARAAGADIVGMEDLAEQVKAGNINFDVVIASPDAMKVVGTLGQILGPRGLMPNPKVGTVTPGPVPDRQGGHHSRRHRPRLVPGRPARDQPEGADRRPEPGQARQFQGRLPAQGGGVEHDGYRCPRRSGGIFRHGRGLSRERTVRNFGPSVARTQTGIPVGACLPAGCQRPQGARAEQVDASRPPAGSFKRDTRSSRVECPAQMAVPKRVSVGRLHGSMESSETVAVSRRERRRKPTPHFVGAGPWE